VAEHMNMSRGIGASWRGTPKQDLDHRWLASTTLMMAAGHWARRAASSVSSS
jgi:hypothetical protein